MILYVGANYIYVTWQSLYGKCQAILIIHLWLHAASYDCSNSTTTLLHYNYEIHSVHIEITLKIVYTLVTYNLCYRPKSDQTCKWVIQLLTISY